MRFGECCYLIQTDNRIDPVRMFGSARTAVNKPVSIHMNGWSFNTPVDW